MTRAFWLLVAAYAATWVGAALTLPDQVPLHFDLRGEPDRWGGRGAALVTFGMVGVGSAGLLGWLLRRVTQGDLRGVNVPHRRWWLANRPDELRPMLARDLGLIAIATMALLTVVLLGFVAGARAEPPALPGWTSVVVVAYVVGLLAWSAYAALVRYRPPAP